MQGELREWKRPQVREGDESKEYPRRVVLNSFGAGGANASLIVEEYQQDELEHPTQIQEPLLLVFSAKNKERLKEYIFKMKEFISRNGTLDLGDAAYTLQTGRDAMHERLAMVVEDRQDFLDKCGAYLNRSDGEKISGIHEGAPQKDDNLDWLSGEETTGLIQSLIEKRDLLKIARLWTRGIDVDWEKLNVGQRRYRISLPTYPFEKRCCWIPITTHVKEKAVIPDTSELSQMDILTGYFQEKIG